VSAPDYMQLVRFESKLINFIRIRMNTLRLGKIIPTWYNYVSSTSDWREVERGLTSDWKRKFRAFWNLMFHCMRHPKDLPSVQLAVAYLVREKRVRGYAKVAPICPEKLGVPGDHALKVEEYVLSNFETLTPGL